MNSLKLLLASLMICLVLVGCGSKTESKDKPKEDKKEVVTGEDISISVPSGDDINYTWTWELSGDDIVVISYSQDVTNCINADGVETNCIGDTSHENFILTAIAKGKATFTLNYIDLKNNNAVVKEAVYEITVDDKLSISEKHHGSYFE